MRALVVEDDPRIARDVAAVLGAAGFRVEAVADGETAWFRGGTEAYDLVVRKLPLSGGDTVRRQIAYVAFGIVSLADGAALVGYAASGDGVPEWLVVATAVIAFLATPFAAIASTNVVKSKSETSPS